MKTDHLTCSRQDVGLLVCSFNKFNASVAQLVEHLIEDQGVVGSIPSGSTKHK